MCISMYMPKARIRVNVCTKCFQTLVIPSIVITRWSKLILSIAGDVHQKYRRKMRRKSGDNRFQKKSFITPGYVLVLPWVRGYLGFTYAHDRWNSTRRNSTCSMRFLVCFGELGWVHGLHGFEAGETQQPTKGVHWCNGDLYRKQGIRGVCESLRLHLAIRPVL